NPKKKFDEIWQGDITYFVGKGEFIQTVRILKENPVIKVSAEYQTCTEIDGLCVLGNADFDLKGLKVSASSPTATVAETSIPAPAATMEPEIELPDTLITDAETVPATQVNTPIAEISAAPTGTEDRSLFAFAIAAFLSGLVALLTPCVFPIIPVTVSYFTKQEGGKGKAFLYGISIVLIYTLIGVVLSRFNGPAFANFLSTHWIPNLLFFGIFILFGLSFLGLFEIVLPNSFINKMDS